METEEKNKGKRKNKMSEEGGGVVFASPHAPFRLRLCVHVRACISASVYPHGNSASDDFISDSLLSRCFPLSVFRNLLRLLSPSEKMYPFQSPSELQAPKASAFPKPPHTGAPQASCCTTGNTPKNPKAPQTAKQQLCTRGLA